MIADRRKIFIRGLLDGIPIALGYLAVALAIGIFAKNAGLSAFQATLASFFNNASAGESIGFTLIAAGATYLEVFLMAIVSNARYLLMSCALSQKLDPSVKLWQRLLIAFDVTDEIFGISVSYPGKLDPIYTFGAMTVAIPGWSIGTCIGVILGNVLPINVVSALSVSLYGMFIAIFIPPARKDKVILCLIIISFAASYIFNALHVFDGISAGIKIIILTIAISLAAALLFPVKEEKGNDT